MRIRRLALVATLVLLGALQASADTLDVIVSTLNDGCSLEEYLEVVDDFNDYYKDKGYRAEILLPLHAQGQNSVVWVGRSPTTTAFGQAYDHWLTQRGVSGSSIAKLDKRLQKCVTTTLRESYVSAR